MSQNNTGANSGLTWGTGTGAGGGYTTGVYTTGNITYTSGPGVYTINTTPWEESNSDITLNGDVIMKGKSLTKILEGIEDRLAIVADVNPEKLQKYAALKEAYDHYRLLEKLLYDSEMDANNK